MLSIFIERSRNTKHREDIFWGDDWHSLIRLVGGTPKALFAQTPITTLQ
jgi:hypothetical protein